MSESRDRAAALMKRLDGNLDFLNTEPKAQLGQIAVPPRRRELRQMAGISAGGSVALEPGTYDIGWLEAGTGRLTSGTPTAIAFRLIVDDNLDVIVEQRSSDAIVNCEPLIGTYPIATEVLSVGDARFVIVTPNAAGRNRRRQPTEPARHLRGGRQWIEDPMPVAVVSESAIDLGDEAFVHPPLLLTEMVDARRRLHLCPDEIRQQAANGGPEVGRRCGGHRLFGTAAVAVADIPAVADGLTIGVAPSVPLSVSLGAGNVTIAGPEHLRLAIARQVVLSLATASRPDQFSIARCPLGQAFDFCRMLPHWQPSNSGSTDEAPALVITNGASDESEIAGDWHLRLIEAPTEKADATDRLTDGQRTNYVCLESLDTLSVGGHSFTASAPLGFSDSMAFEIAADLAEVYRGADSP